MANKKTAHKKPKPAHTAEAVAKTVADASEKVAKTATKNFYDLQRSSGMEKIMTQSKTNFDKFGQDAAAAGKDHVEAIVRSGSIFAKGFEDFLKTYGALAQTTAERNAQAFKTLLSSKTLNEFTETQSRVAQENLDDFLSGVTKLSEIGVKLATETLAPLNDQVNKTMKKASDALAA